MENDRIICIKKRKSYIEQCENIENYRIIDVTSNNNREKVAHELSPLWLGPVRASDGEMCERFENLWQYTKVYSEFTGADGNPTPEYFQWRSKAFSNTDKGVRFPFGKVRKPEYAYWNINGEWYKLGYLSARKIIYIPEYAKLVTQTDCYKILKEFYDNGGNLALCDYDAYNNYHPDYNMNMVQVYNFHKKAGHAFVLKMLLEGDIEVINGQVVDNIGVLKVTNTLE